MQADRRSKPSEIRLRTCEEVQHWFKPPAWFLFYSYISQQGTYPPIVIVNRQTLQHTLSRMSYIVTACASAQLSYGRGEPSESTPKKAVGHLGEARQGGVRYPQTSWSHGTMGHF